LQIAPIFCSALVSVNEREGRNGERDEAVAVQVKSCEQGKLFILHLKNFNMKNPKLAFILSSVFVLAIIGCKKGDAGPAGPVGPAGPDSVTYSPRIILNTPLSVSTAGDSSYSQTVTATSITQAVLDKAVIVSYVNLANDPSSEVDLVPLAALSFVITETFFLGSIDLFSPVDLTGIPYRFVIVPGTIQGNKFISGPATGLTKSEVQTMSYKDIQKLLGKPAQASSN